MVEYISYALIASALSLGAWILSGENKSISKLFGAVFYMSILAYGAMIFTQDWSLPSKLVTVSRDIILLSGFSALVMAARKIKILPYIILLTFGFNAPTLSTYIKKNTPFNLKFASSEKSTQAQEASEAKHDNKGLSENGELLIELRTRDHLSELEEVAKTYNLEYSRAFHPADEEASRLDEYYLVNIPDDKIEMIDEISTALRRTNRVLWSEPNEMMTLDVKPGDPVKEKHNCNHVDDPLDPDQWMHEVIGMDKYYGLLETLKADVKEKANLFILDSGVDGNHEDLIESYSSLNSDYDTDGNGHGTHCAGVAAATTNNGKGIASFTIGNEFITVTGVKVMSSFGFGTQKMIIDGMIEAADNGADVISMSLGGATNQTRQKAYNTAVEYVNKKGCIVIVAAGNSSMDAARYSPANSRGVIAVAATDENSLKASFTNTVENIKFGISAPGVNIMSTLPNDEYKALSGTSMAAPHVAGLIAVMKSLRPELDTREAYDIINKTGAEVEDHFQIGRMMQPYDAVKMLVGESI